jgi:hypothetical protein
MRKILALAVLFVSASTIAFGQSPTQAPAKPATQEKTAAEAKSTVEKMTASGNVEQELIQFRAEANRRPD